MIEMSSGYAHESNVGPVFEITAWSPTKSIGMAISGLVFATVFLFTATFLWNPKILEGKMPPGTEDLIGEVVKAQTTHRWEMRGGMAFLAGFGLLFGVASIAWIRDGLHGDYYFRAGPGGLSVRLPNGLSWAQGGIVSAVRELDLPWSEIEGLTVVQTKQLGSLSRNAGNITADLQITMHSGEKHHISLDGLEAAAYLIHQRLNEAQHMVPAELDEPEPAGV